MNATVLSHEYLVSTEPWPKDATIYHTNEENQMLLDEQAELYCMKALLDMHKLNYHTICVPNAEWMSPNGHLPFLRLGDNIATGFDETASYISEKKLSLDENFSQETGLISELVKKIFPNAEKFVCWFTDTTYSEYTVPRYSRPYPWPINYILTWQKRRSIGKQIEYNYQIINEFDSCCQTLHEQLTSINSSGSKFFSRTQKPSSLDALVYGHVKAILDNEQLGDFCLSEKINDPLIKHNNDVKDYISRFSRSSDY